jgi:hypothetical protein
VRIATRREALLGGLVLALAAVGLWPDDARTTQTEAFRALVGGHAPAGGVASWEEIADAFFRYDGEAATICRTLAGAGVVPSGDRLACLTRPEAGIDALEAVRRRAIEFFVFGTDLLDPGRAPGDPVRFVATPDPMSGRFCNPVARFDVGEENV